MISVLANRQKVLHDALDAMITAIASAWGLRKDQVDSLMGTSWKRPFWSAVEPGGSTQIYDTNSSSGRYEAVLAKVNSIANDRPTAYRFVRDSFRSSQALNELIHSLLLPLFLNKLCKNHWGHFEISTEYEITNFLSALNSVSLQRLLSLNRSADCVAFLILCRAPHTPSRIRVSHSDKLKLAEFSVKRKDAL